MDEDAGVQNMFLDPNDKNFWANVLLVVIFHKLFISEEVDQND